MSGRGGRLSVDEDHLAVIDLRLDASLFAPGVEGMWSGSCVGSLWHRDRLRQMAMQPRRGPRLRPGFQHMAVVAVNGLHGIPEAFGGARDITRRVEIFARPEISNQMGMDADPAKR